MKRVVDYCEPFDDQKNFIENLLKQWRPTSFELTEKEQEQALMAWLQQQLPDVPIVAQYGIAKGKADLVIQDTFVIELKLAFTDDSLAEFDRCIGQLERYRQKWVTPDRGPIFLVVVGKSGPEFRDMLHKAVAKMDGEFFGKWFFLIEKHP